ncbi:hypothetical protein FRC08_008465 [Ceratobasidium sp. 394]|nr:hypothetical protein FRC08_008465 [Ceratobasidium sp. 394]
MLVPEAAGVEPGLYNGMSVGACPRFADVGVGEDAGSEGTEDRGDRVLKRESVLPEAAGVPGSDAGPAFTLVPAAGRDFKDSVLRPAWNLRSAANAAASLGVVPVEPPAPGVDTPLASGGVLFGTGTTF